MDDLGLGGLVRAVRVRRGWRQRDLAAVARVSAATISRIEHGHLESISVATLRRVAAALEIRIDLTPRWRGGELDRLLDAGHATLVQQVIQILRIAGWSVIPEASFSVYGERGSIDILAFHPSCRMLLVIEVKTELTDLQRLISTLDRKRRLASGIARDRGWDAAGVSVWVVVAEGRSNRRRVSSFSDLLRTAYPADGRAVHRWLRNPSRAVSGLSFLPNVHPRNARPASSRRLRRVARQPSSV